VTIGFVGFNFVPETPEPTEDPLLRAAFHALRSYQYGNASPDLAKEIADKLEVFLKQKAGKP
jgi:hypothetical protein